MFVKRRPPDQPEEPKTNMSKLKDKEKRKGGKGKPRVSYADDDTQSIASESSIQSSQLDLNAMRNPRASTTTGWDSSDTRKSNVFSSNRKTRQSIGGYTSLFARKLLPPLGFYREVDKYAQLKAKFESDGDYEKVDALEEMWSDYKKYQIRKRFRWPPIIFFKKFFWTTGYYADYQKKHRATTLRKPGEDSSEDEFVDPTGQFMIAGADGDINLNEFERYRQAKAMDPNKAKRYTRYDIKPIDEMSGDDGGYGDGTGPRGDDYAAKGKGKGKKIRDGFDNESDDGGSRRASKGSRGTKQEVEEVETIVEYTMIPNPNKRKSIKKKKGTDNDESALTAEAIAAAVKEAEEMGNAPPVIGRRKSTVVKTIKTDRATGEQTVDVQEKEESDVPDVASEASAPSFAPRKQPKPAKGKKKPESKRSY